MWIFLIAVICLPEQFTAVSDVEYYTLESLYNSTEGDYWVWTGDGVAWNFNGSDDPCLAGWEGVTCTPSCLTIEECSVTGISLPLHNLTGHLPDNIDGLDNLISFDLSYNRVIGTLPSAFSLLPALKDLNLKHMCLSGNLPAMHNLTSLVQLNLAYNFFEGPLPDLAYLPAVQVLDLSGNRYGATDINYTTSLNDNVSFYFDVTCGFYNSSGFEGSVPDSLWALSELQLVSLEGNSLSGSLKPAGVVLSQLFHFDVSDNKLNGMISPVLSQIPNVGYLDISNNWFAEELTDNIFDNANHLTYFNASENVLTGCIPSSLSMLSMLQTLSLYGNSLLSTLPVALTRLSALRHLSIGRGNCISGPIPDNVGDLSSLVYLEISGAILIGSLPTSISKLTALQFLDLHYNKKKRDIARRLERDSCHVSDNLVGLTGDLIPFWREMPNLETIDISRNWINGTMPSDLSSVPKLKVLNLRDNILRGPLRNITGVPMLQELHLDTNFFVGTLPSSYGSLTTLTELTLGFNYLRGTIPESWAKLEKLRALVLRLNRLGDKQEIPSFLWKLSNLALLELSLNHFSGTLSGNISNLIKLQALHIDNNYLHGEIPSDLFEHCTSLRTINFSNNSFTGEIPPSISSLVHLDEFSAENNSLSKVIPGSITLLTNLVNLRLGNNRFTGPLPDWDRFMPRLKYFGAKSNLLTGTIPRLFGQRLTALRELSLSNNSLFGDIPANLLHSTSLTRLDLSSNSLDGSLPDTCDNCDVAEHALSFLALYDNKLRGRIPQSLIEHNTKLTALVLYFNEFEGPLPDYTKLPDLELISVSGNRFTGTLSAYSQALSMLYFDVSNNDLEGTIPSSFGYQSQLRVLFLQNNKFSGPLPSEFSFPNLIDLRLHGNSFTSTLPVWIGDCKKLGNLFVNGNAFEGDLGTVLHNNANQSIQHIDVSDNKFTGSLPSGVFTMLELSTFAASKNCFSGGFPNTLCSAPKLEMIVMGALSTSSACSSVWRTRIPFFPVFTFNDELPACLLGMRNMQEIYLSGNGLRGRLPPLNSTFKSIQLDNNEFTGTIPASYVQFTRESLSLVRNRLDGGLPNVRAVPDGLEVRLKLNRLSGTIPKAYNSVKQIDILDGNIFDCNSEGSLPNNDPNSAEYTCGSNLLNYSLYAWLTLIAASVGIVGGLYWLIKWRTQKETASVSQQGSLDDSQPEKQQGLDRFTFASHFTVQTLKSQLSFALKSERWKPFEDLWRWYRTGASLAAGSSVALRKHMERHSFGQHSSAVDAAQGSTRTEIDVKIDLTIFNKYKYSTENRNSEMSRFITSLLIIRSLTIILAIAILIVLLPTYRGLKTDMNFSTHDMQYTWAYTAAFTSSRIVAIILGIIWFFLCGFFFWVVFIAYRDFFTNTSSPHCSNSHVGRNTNADPERPSIILPSIIFGFVISPSVKRAIRAIAAISINTTIVILATYLYIYTFLDDASSGAKLYIQLGFSVWKVVWNTFGVPTCFHAMNWLSHQNKVFIYILTLFFNNAFSAMVTTAVSDPSCFNEIWYKQKPEYLQYFGLQCVQFSPVFDRCLLFATRVFSVEFTSPLVYNYLCASQILRSFIPIFFYVYAGTLFSLPAIFFLLARKEKKKWPRLVIQFAPAILWPADIAAEGTDIYLMRPNIVMNTMVGHIMIILTFGIFCPPLAVTIAITVFVITSMWVLLIGRFVEIACMSCSQNKYESARILLDHTFSRVWTTLYVSRWTIVICAGSCYAVLIFDYIGDDYGVIQAFTGACFMGFFFILMYWFSTVLNGNGVIYMEKKFMVASNKPRLVMLEYLHMMNSIGVQESLIFADPNDKYDLYDDEVDSGIRLTEYTASEIASGTQSIATDRAKEDNINVENPIFCRLPK